MAAASASASTGFGNPATSTLPSRHANFGTSMISLGRFASAGKLRVTATSPVAVVETVPPEARVDEVGKSIGAGQRLLSCPICFEQLILVDGSGSSGDSVSKTTLLCEACNKEYGGPESHLDLTVSSGTKVYGEALALSTEFFRFPLISYLYERGWRQSFSVWGGFPGPEKEFDLMKGFMKPVLGGNIVDASCGSGLFSRLFAKSGLFSLVIALDYSESMLKQCYDYARQEEDFPKEKLLLVRADISRLPFASRSINVVHAGAALHCWPSPSTAVAEISRVLKPGGVFVATTYLLDGPFSLIPFLRPLRQNIVQVSGSHVFLGEQELEDLCRACGLINFKCVRNRRFVMISARKPS